MLSTHSITFIMAKIKKSLTWKQFLKMQAEFIYMIRDRAPECFLDYHNYGIKEVCLSVKSTDMNSIAVRFIGSVRREALDYFLILNKKQLKDILTEYIEYYNSFRPHLLIRLFRR